MSFVIPDGVGFPMGVLAAGDYVQFSGAAFVGAGAAGFVGWGNGSVAAAADTRFLSPWHDPGTASLTSVGAWRAPRAFTARNLRVRHNSAVGNGNSVAYFLRINGVNTALTVSLATGAVGDASDLVNAVAVAAGDLVEFVAVKALGIGAGGVDAVAVLQVS